MVEKGGSGSLQMLLLLFYFYTWEGANGRKVDLEAFRCHFKQQNARFGH